ncbi:hypothetical protein TVAG_086290 [Trichomonas vaginalis G3]|uniref:protein disulfide-isomerase n=1 Tax=Trichomonas vaginalis (strain ATCC PRA-98 / G3) TaxID=412133 RepID=A2FDD9_TRIV3|nr:intramolecular oxidoreductase activity, transposing S-S bonds [Trichomonas vaginalis G3]EAX97090.1 hypothetical protein TVAG_086290 [Trichomonas vaginalis G3]KAI5518791.1 intramolecular oxidoreductase activity, transposing S-S bonds [Trichomonas vaginalis G3]|eukprot:XP_001310020.1 hypothetical protein [Trichomonas vaginalis G3]
MLSFFLALTLSKQSKLSKNLEETNILYLTESNFSRTVKELPAFFLFIYQGGDKNEQYRAVRDFLATASGLGTRCYFGVLDGEKNRNIVRKLNLIYTRGYYFYRYGKRICNYYGSQTTGGFLNFVMSKTGMPFTTFDDYPSAQDVIEGNEVTVVLFIPKVGGPDFDKFTELSEILRDNFTFGLVADELLADDLNVSKFPTLKLYRNVDHAQATYNEDFSTASLIDITSWINYNSRPLINVFQINKQDDYIKKKPVIVFFVPVNEEPRAQIMPTIVKLSENFGEDLNFTQIDAVTGNRFMMDLGFSRYADPCVAILQYTGRNKFTKNRFPEDADFIYEDISSWIIEYLDGKMKAEVKSSDVPQDYNGSIRFLSANNFKEEVIDPDVAVLVLYFEPWDQQFQRFKDIFTEIADEFMNKSVKRVRLAALNVHANDIVYGPEPKRTPCLYLFNRGSKDKPELYTGKFNKEAVVDFLDDETGVRTEL